MELQPGSGRALATKAQVLREMGDIARALDVMADEAFYWLDVAKKMKLPWYPWLITWYPGLQDLRDDPRMRERAEELNLSEALNRALGWLSA